jgi:hypothetical protein
METKAKLEEVFDILTATLKTGRAPTNLYRAHRLLESALGEFFDNEDDVAVLPDEETMYLGAEPPSPVPDI